MLTLSNGENIINIDDFGYSILLYAARYNYENIVELIINSGIDINYKNKHQNSALIYATKYNNINIVKLLLLNGANVNDKDKTGTTPLMYASINGNLEIMHILLKYEANVNDIDTYGCTSLMHAIFDGDQIVIEFLNTKNVDIHKPFDRKDIIKVLLDNGADINIKDIFGKTLLMHSIVRNNCELMSLLIENNADIYTTDTKGTNILELANKICNIQFIEFIKNIYEDKTFEDYIPQINIEI
jgi:ankyrin repeat protein